MTDGDAGGPESTTGDHEPTSDDRESPVGDRGPADGDQDGSTSDHGGTTGDREDDAPGDPAVGDRRDRVTRHPTPGPGNSLQSWTDAKHPLRVTLNYVVVVAARHAPSLRLKNWLLRRIGVDVGRGVSWGLESTPDVFWPELITVGDDAIVGYDATLLCHEFLQDEYRTGEVRVGERAMIGAGAVVLPGVVVGADAQVAANSLVSEDVPPGETWAGVPAEPVDGSGPVDGSETVTSRTGDDVS